MPKFTIQPPSGQAVTVEAGSQEEALDHVLNTSGPDVTALGSFGRGAVDMLPLGNQAYAGIAGLAEHKPYLQERQELNQEIAADKETNPSARLAGQVTGVVAPIVATAGLAAPESLAAAAGQGALYGGAFGAGNAIDTVASGGSGIDAAKDVALGAGLGAVGGGAGHLATGFLKGLGGKAVAQQAEKGEPIPQALVKAEAPTPIAAEDLVKMPQNGGPDLPGAARMPSEAPIPAPEPSGIPQPETPPTVQAKQGFTPSDSEMKAEVLMGVLGGTPGQMRKLPGKDMIQSINRMGDVIRANSTKELPLISMGDRYADRLNKFVKWQDQAGKTIGDTIDKANVAPLNIGPIKEALRGAMEFPGIEDQAVLSKVAESLDKYAKIDKTPGSLSFQRLQDLKGRIGKEAFEGQGNKALQSAYHVISDLQDSELDKAASLINKPAFTAAKEAYQVASRAIPMLRTATARSLAKGYHSFGTPLAALVTGHPLDALKHVLEEPVKRAVNAAAFNAPHIGEALGSAPAKVAASTAGQVAAVAAPTDLHLQHPAMAPWKQAFDKGAAAAKNPAEAQKAHAVTDFTLSQNSPAYSKAKQEATDAVEKGWKPEGMAEGGFVGKIKDKVAGIGPVEGFGSTLEGFKNLVEPPPTPETLPEQSPTTPKFHQPFNNDIGDKLREYLEFMKKEREDGR